MAKKICDGIYTFEIPLPENPLKSLNCYVVLDEFGRSLLIDTGFKRPECQTALLKGMEELALDPHKTDVFITHLHSDHAGNAPMLAEMGCNIIMGRLDHDILLRARAKENRVRMTGEGMPPEQVEKVLKTSPAIIYSSGPFDALCVDDGDVLSYGGFELQCVVAPGHTPGHMCLYDEKHKLMFLGDNVLFDITPNITFWQNYPDALGNYLKSLRRIKEFDVEIGLPGHRSQGRVSVGDRADALIAHHEARITETWRILSAAPEGISAYDTAGQMTWSIRTRNWGSFPLSQKWFAVGETIAHLEYLTLRGYARREEDSAGNAKYYLI